MHVKERRGLGNAGHGVVTATASLHQCIGVQLCKCSGVTMECDASLLPHPHPPSLPSLTTCSSLLNKLLAFAYQSQEVREGVKKNVFIWDFVPNIGPHPPTAHVWDSTK